MFSKPNNSANKQDLTSDTFPMQHQCHINVKHNDQQGVHADLQRMQSPIFNIHIHVPPYQGDDLKMYLPRIQPVIHLHFDELARQLQLNQEEQSEDATYRALEKLLAMTSPRFGNVKFHYQSEPNETVRRSKEFQCQEKKSETVNRNKQFSRTAPSFSLNYFNDGGPHASGNSRFRRFSRRIRGNCGIPDCCGSQSSAEDNDSTLDDNMSESDVNNEEALKQKFNLKEAVVVLEDVCKTEYYKSMVAAGLIRDSTVESDESESDDDLESAGDQENMITSVQDCGNCYIKRESESYSPEHGSSSRGKAFSQNINTNSLNPSSGMMHRLSSPPGSTQNRSNIRISESSEKTLSALAEGCKFSDILSRFQIKKCVESDEESVKCIEDITHSEGLRRNEEYNRMNGPEDTVLKSPSKENLDGMPWTSQGISSKTRLEMISALCPTWHKRILKFPETRENKLVNLGVSGFRLDVFEEEMGRSNNGRTGRNLKKKAIEVESASSKESTPSKKMKQSDDNLKKSRVPSEMEDYIPLQASGPTKFVVAPLNKVNPYKSHDARNFKADMLYGKRINRFSSSDQLRIYQLKQEAAKTQTN